MPRTRRWTPTTPSRRSGSRWSIAADKTTAPGGSTRASRSACPPRSARRATVFTATTRDLSEGGVGLSAEYPLEEGSEVVLGLFLVLDDVESDTPPLWVKARVAWAAETDDNRFNAGVRFEVITDDQRKWLRQILAAMAPPPASPGRRHPRPRARAAAEAAPQARARIRSATRAPSSAALTIPPA